MASAIMKVKGDQATTGPRGEFQHVSAETYSINFWHLRGMSRSDSHTNPYDLAIFITEGELSVYDEDGTENVIASGDSVLVPANTTYSMSAESADAVETRVYSTR